VALAPFLKKVCSSSSTDTQVNLGTLLGKTQDTKHLLLSAEAEWQELPCAVTNTTKRKSRVRRGALHKRDGKKKHLPRQEDDPTDGDKGHVGLDFGLSSCLQRK
jgi:hypothetical protein